MNSSLYGNNNTSLASPKNSSSSNITVFVTWSGPYVREIHATMGFITLLNNFLVVCVFLAFRKSLGKRMTTVSSNFHITWQSCVDATIGLILILNKFLEADGTPKYVMGNIGHEFICRLWNSNTFLWCSLDLSALAVLLLNFERYMAVVHPIHHMTKFAKNRRLSLVMVSFTVCLAVAYRFSNGILTCRIISDGRCALFIEVVSPTYQMFMGVSAFLLDYVIPLSLTFFLYISMALKLHRKIAPEQQKVSEVSYVSSLSDFNISEEKNAQKNDAQDTNFDLVKTRNNILKTSMLLSFSFIICWSTNQFYRILYFCGVIPLGDLKYLYHFSIFMLFANSFINPFIYCLKYKPFQQSVKAIWFSLIKMIKQT